MKITLKLFATLREYGEKVIEIEVKDGACPLDVMIQTGVPSEEVAIIMINGRRLLEDTILKDNDVLALFPAVGGG